MATVLIVEDEDQVRVLAKSYLREHGHQTVSATAEEALAVFEVVERIDVLFTDINSRGDVHSGLEVAKQATTAPAGSRRALRHRPAGHRLHAGDDGRELCRVGEAVYDRPVAGIAVGALSDYAAQPDVSDRCSP